MISKGESNSARTTHIKNGSFSHRLELLIQEVHDPISILCKYLLVRDGLRAGRKEGACIEDLPSAPLRVKCTNGIGGLGLVFRGIDCDYPVCGVCVPIRKAGVSTQADKFKQDVTLPAYSDQYIAELLFGEYDLRAWLSTICRY